MIQMQSTENMKLRKMKRKGQKGDRRSVSKSNTKTERKRGIEL